MISFQKQTSTIDHAIKNTVLAKLNSVLETSMSHTNPDLYNPSSSLGKSLYPVDMTHGLSTEIGMWSNSMKDESSVLIDAIGSDTLSFGPVTLSEGLSLIKNEITSGTFYGVVAVNSLTNERINPLHPLIAKEISENWDIYKDQKFNFYIFSGNWRGDPDADLELYTNSIVQLLSEYGERQLISYVSSTLAVVNNDIEIPITSDENVQEILYNYMDGKSIELVDSTLLKLPNGNSPYFIVPVQIVSDGIAYPYYGTSLLQQDIRNSEDSETEDLWGTDLSPMGSANIGNNTTNPTASEFFSVCTGGHGVDDYGMATINQSNLQSPMNSECLSPEWREYVAACLNISYEIFDSLLDSTPQKILTRADFDTIPEWLEHLSTLHLH